MKYFYLSILVLALSACNEKGDKDRPVVTVTPISIGVQIDRIGRAAANTALNNTFSDDATRGAAEDLYNSTSNDSASVFRDEIASKLAIYDALADEGSDDNACGDNPLTNRASANPVDGLASGDERYNFLATVLADDQLYINASSSLGSDSNGCNQYLAAELSVIGVTGLGADCGGRTPLYDVIETTYSAVAIGMASGVDDGIMQDDVTHSDTMFPFLAAPI